MKAQECAVCGHPLYADNTHCESCGTRLAYARAERRIVPVDAAGTYVDADDRMWFTCRNGFLAGCTWLASTPGGQCSGCDLTRTRPNDDDTAGLAAFKVAEAAKRHLVIELDALGCPVVDRHKDPERGLAFDLLSSADADVVTGHAGGVVTIDLAESDDARREHRRALLGEPYRTMLGHLRHEVGHYYQWLLVRDGEVLDGCRALFGDETADYAAAVERHYTQGPPPGWEREYLSAYATMHPFEDFAETWAHYLHITDAVQTALAFGLLEEWPLAADAPFRDVVTRVWVPLSIALNQMNRAMGAPDVYPFVIPAPALDKLDWVASLVRAGES